MLFVNKKNRVVSLKGKNNTTMSFVFSDLKAVEFDKNIAIQYRNNDTPVIQDLGWKEGKISVRLYVYGASSLRLEEDRLTNDFTPVIYTADRFKANYVRRQERILADYNRKMNFLYNLSSSFNTTVIFTDPYLKQYKCIVQSCKPTLNMENETIFDLSLIVVTPLTKIAPDYETYNLNTFEIKNWFDKIGETCSKYWRIYNNVANNTMNAVNGVLDSILGVKNDVLSVVNNIDKLTQQIQILKNNIRQIINSPMEIRNAITNLGQNFRDAFSNNISVSGVGSINKKFLPSNVKDDNIALETYNLTTNKPNSVITEQALLQKDFIDFNQKMFYFENFAELLQTIEVNNIEDKKILQDISNTLYEEVMNCSMLNNPNMSIETMGFKTAIINLKVQIDGFIDNLEVKNIIEINVENETLIDILYAYYGNINYYDDIIKLNNYNYIDVLNISGTIKIYGE